MPIVVAQKEPNVTVVSNVPISIRDAIKAEAAKEGVSMSVFVAHILEEWKANLT